MARWHLACWCITFVGVLPRGKELLPMVTREAKPNSFIVRVRDGKLCGNCVGVFRNTIADFALKSSGFQSLLIFFVLDMVKCIGE